MNKIIEKILIKIKKAKVSSFIRRITDFQASFKIRYCHLVFSIVKKKKEVLKHFKLIKIHEILKDSPFTKFASGEAINQASHMMRRLYTNSI